MYTLNDWVLTDNGTTDEDILTNGNRFMSGNGYFGYRGTVEEADASNLCACVLNGVYDRHGDKWREPVNAPNGLSVRITAGKNEMLSLKSESLASHTQGLNFRYGIHFRETVWNAEGGRVTVKAERFASLSDVHLLCMKYTVRAEADIRIGLRPGIDCAVWDINGPHLEDHVFSHKDSALLVTCRTRELGIPVACSSAYSFEFNPDLEAVENRSGIYFGLTLKARKNTDYTFSLVYGIYTGNDTKEDPAFTALASSKGAASIGYENLLSSHKKAWDAVWDSSDVVIEGDASAQRAMRYSLYHLHIIAPRHSPSLSIPARGLSGQTYKGAVFWDTEMFISPFFLFTEPETAKRFIRYRINTLGGARRKAAEYGYRGAFYAWESQETGDDACSHFNVVDVFTGRPMRTYFRDRQIHISADIVYAIRKYIDVTGDASVLEEGGLEVILECARFFISRTHYSHDKARYEVLDVTGPDEYHERVNNNAFTNRMIRHVFDTALDCIARLENENPAYLQRVLDKIDFRKDGAFLREIRDGLYIPQPNADSVIEQFDGYFSLEDCTLAEVKSRILDPKEYWGGSNGIASGTRIIKQADVILMLSLFGDEYSTEVKKANIDFYEKRTEHGSSLSPCAYSLLSCETGDSEWAYPFFRKTSEIDITGESKQFAGLVYIGGTHPAANGGAWMAAVQGFCGFGVSDGKIRVQPRLPSAWIKVSFQARVRGTRYSITVTKDGYAICER